MCGMLPFPIYSDSPGPGRQDLNPWRLALQPDTVPASLAKSASFSRTPLSPPTSPVSAHPHLCSWRGAPPPHSPPHPPPVPLPLLPTRLPLPFLLGAAPSSSWSSEPKYATPGAIAAAPRPGPHYGPALISACITLFHFKESAEKPVPGRQQKVKTQLTPIRALSQAPREVMKYGSGEICNALLSGLSYNGVHANYACRLPPAPGRRTTQRAPGPRPGLWGGGEEGRGEDLGRGSRLGRRGGQ